MRSNGYDGRQPMQWPPPNGRESVYPQQEEELCCSRCGHQLEEGKEVMVLCHACGPIAQRMTRWGVVGWLLLGAGSGGFIVYQIVKEMF